MTTMMPVLETNRLVIRPLLLSDLDAVTQVLDHDRWEQQGVREARQTWLRWTVLNYDALAELSQPPYGDRAAVLKEAGHLVGICGYAPTLLPFEQLTSFASPGVTSIPARSTLETGLFWAVAPSHRGRGYAAEAAGALITYAFDTLELKRVVAVTTFDNSPSIRVMRKLGMHIERNPLPTPRQLQVVGSLDSSLVSLSRPCGPAGV